MLRFVNGTARTVDRGLIMSIEPMLDLLALIMGHRFKSTNTRLVSDFDVETQTKNKNPVTRSYLRGHEMFKRRFNKLWRTCKFNVHYFTIHHNNLSKHS